MNRHRKATPVGGIARGAGTRECDKLNRFGGKTGQGAHVPTEQTDRAHYDRVKNRLHVRLRAADHAQDVAGGRLRVQRRRQVAVARLQFLEQPYVLDGDDGLVGEGLQKLDVLVGEGTRILPRAHRDGSDGDAVAQHGDGERTPEGYTLEPG